MKWKLIIYHSAAGHVPDAHTPGSNDDNLCQRFVRPSLRSICNTGFQERNEEEQDEEIKADVNLKIPRMAEK